MASLALAFLLVFPSAASARSSDPWVAPWSGSRGNGDDAPSSETLSECMDGIDNDGDGRRDFGNDLGCSGPDDRRESGARWNETIMTDDGEPDTYYAGADVGSRFEKRLLLPADGLRYAERAEFRVYAQTGAAPCAWNYGLLSFRVNGQLVSSFNPCSTWPSTGWASFNVPPQQLTAGLPNSFSLTKDIPLYPGSVLFALDTDRDEGGSDASSNGVDHPGELLARLVLHKKDGGPQCTDGLDNDADGAFDLDDTACSNAQDDDEGNGWCSDGLDNEGDGRIDGGDPECTNPSAKGGEGSPPIASGANHMCFVLQNRNVDCWGDSTYRQNDDYLGGDAVEVSAGGSHTCVLKSNGNVDCWGNGIYDQNDDYLGGDAVAISAGAWHTCALKSNGNVDCYGYPDNGRADDYTGGDAIAVSAGDYNTCVLKSNGNVDCYGYDGWGQAKDYTGGDAIAVSTNGWHTCVLKSNGNVDCYGSYYYSDPAGDYTGGDAIAIAAGYYHACVLKSDGSVECFGRNNEGQANGYSTGDAIALAAGFGNTCILKSSRGVACWGDNDLGQSVPYQPPAQCSDGVDNEGDGESDLNDSDCSSSSDGSESPETPQPAEPEPCSNALSTATGIVTGACPSPAPDPNAPLDSPLPVCPTDAVDCPDTLPPSFDDVQEVTDAAWESLDDSLRGADPTGTVASPSSLRNRMVTQALNQKLAAYQQQLVSGAQTVRPFEELAFEDIDIEQGFLPDVTYVQGLNLVGDLLSTIAPSPNACLKPVPGGARDTPVNLDATCSNDAQTSTRDLAARWDWQNDGAWDTGYGPLTASTAYSSSGTKTVKVEVKDPDGYTASATTTVRISTPPEACLRVSPGSGTTWDTYTFNASCSRDDLTDHSALQFRFNFDGDETFDTSWSNVQSASRNYGAPGTYEPVVQVRDSTDLVGSATATVKVLDPHSGGGGSGGGDCSPEFVESPQATQAGIGDPTGGGGGPITCGNTPGSGTMAAPGVSPDPLLQGVAEPLGIEAAAESLGFETGSYPVLVRRLEGGPYEPILPGEVQFWAGERLRFAPPGEHAAAARKVAPLEALVEVAWLETVFGTYGSAKPFHARHLDGVRYVVLDDPQILQGRIDALRAIVFPGSDLYTLGHRSMVAVQDHAMKIHLEKQPERKVTWATRETPDGPEIERFSSSTGELGISFTGANTSGQDVVLDTGWLSSLGLDTPRFRHEDGTILAAERHDGWFTVHAPHFSTIYVENFDDGSAYGWTFTGLWHVKSGPSCSSAHSASYYLAYTKDSTCTYNTGARTMGDAIFTTTLETGNPTLSFYHKYTVASSWEPVDRMRVRLSTNGGSTWNDLAQWSSVSAATSIPWTYQSYDLTGYAGLTVNIAFSFDSVDEWSNSHLGWLVDGVQVADGTFQPNAPPSACFAASPGTGTRSTEFTVNASCSHDGQTADADLFVRWDWEEDGTFTSWSKTKTSTHTYADWSGWQTIVLQVRDGNGAVSTVSDNVYVEPLGPNAPNACFEVEPTVGSTATTYLVNAECSWDEETSWNNLQFRWDWSWDGDYASPYFETGWSTDKSASTTYQTTGRRLIRMQVTDGDSIVTTTRYVDVTTTGTNTPPVVCLDAPSTGTAGVPFTVDAGCSHDGTETPAADLEVRWDEGNGQFTAWSKTKTRSLTYSTPGPQTITMQVRDDAGAVTSGSWGVSIYSPNQSPDACFTVSPDTTGFPSTVFTFDASCSWDDASGLRYSWDWTNNGGFDSGPFSSPTASYRYSQPGTYTVRLGVRDAAGSWSYATNTVTVLNTGPAARVQASHGYRYADEPFVFDASGTQDPDTPLSQLQFRWNWEYDPDWEDDETYDTPWTSASSASHAYEAAGPKTVRVAVRDPHGGVGTATLTVSVTDTYGSAGTGLSQEFDSSLDGWTATGLWHVSNSRAYDGSPAAARYGRAGALDYDTGYRNSGILRSPKFTVPDENPVLTLATWHSTEGGSSRDLMLVEISRDGFTWRELGQETGNQQKWEERRYPLDEYASEDVRVRFRFDTVEASLNGFEGWYIDHLGVAQATTVDAALYSTEWYESSVTGPKETRSRVYDETAEKTAYWMNDPSDSAMVQLDAPEGGSDGTAWLSIYGWGGPCDGYASHRLLINGQVHATFSPCEKWPNSGYSWGTFSFPSALLKAGLNEFALQSFCKACTSALLLPASQGCTAMAKVVVNGQDVYCKVPVWELRVVAGEQEYKTLERYETSKSPGEDGNPVYETVHTRMVYVQPDDLHTVRSIARQSSNGETFHVSTDLRFAQRGTYNSRTHWAGWRHEVHDPDDAWSDGSGVMPPVNGQYYTWYVAETDTHSLDEDGQPTDLHHLALYLVPSAPISSDDVTVDTAYEPNPPLHGTDQDGDGSSRWIEFNLEFELKLKACKELEFEHLIGDNWDFVNNHKGRHFHDCFRLALHAFDLDKRPSSVVDAAGGVKSGFDWMMFVLDETPLKKFDWAKKVLKLNVLGPEVDWLFSIAQSGDIFSVELTEKDGPTWLGRIPRTVFSMVPAIPGWTFPFDPQMPVHTFPLQGMVTVDETYSLEKMWS